MIDRCVLKVDIDQPFEDVCFQHFIKKVNKILEITGLHFSDKNVEMTESQNGNAHIQLWFKEELLPLEKLFLQCWLGDDRLRCLFNFRRIRRGQVNWNILFSNKEVSECSGL